MSRFQRLLGVLVLLPAVAAGTVVATSPAEAVGPTVGVADSVTVSIPSGRSVTGAEWTVSFVPTASAHASGPFG